MRHRILSIVGALLVVGIFAAGVAIRFREAQLAAAELDSLLAGSDTISIEILEVTLQQRRVVCRDRLVLDEIAAILRKPSAKETGGSTYHFEFLFSSGRRYAVDGEVDRTSFALAIPSARPVEGWWPTHFFDVPQSASSRASAILVFLNAPWEEVAGLSLTLNEDQQLIYAYDRELHGGNPCGSRVVELTNAQ